jgi:hypothetical protein
MFLFCFTFYTGIKYEGRIKKTWEECMNKDLVDLGLKKEWAQDRTNWRDLIWGTVEPMLEKPT